MAVWWNQIRARLKGAEPVPATAPKSCCAHASPSTPRPDYPKDKTIRRVFIVEGCLVCNACEAECPEVFKLDVSKPVAIQSSEVLPGAGKYFETLRDQIEYVASQCHVAVIGIEYADGTFSPLGTKRGKVESVVPDLTDIPLELIQE